MSDWLDREPVADHVPQGVGLPYFQWRNGKPAESVIHPVLGSGGWVFDMSSGANIGLELPFPKTVMVTESGKQVPIYAPGELSVAVLATRFRWVEAKENARFQIREGGHLQIACLVKGIEHYGLFSLSARSTTAMALSYYKEPLGVLQTFDKMVLARAAQIRRSRLPRYYFWLTIKAGPIVMVGQKGKQSPVTPPIIVLPPALQRPDSPETEVKDALSSIFTGDQVIDQAEALWDEAQAWADEWRKSPVATKDDVVPDEENVAADRLDEEPATAEPREFSRAVDQKALEFIERANALGYTPNESQRALAGMQPHDFFASYPDASVDYALARLAAATGRSENIGAFLTNVTLVYPDLYPTHQAVIAQLRKLGVKEQRPEKEAEYWAMLKPKT